MVAERCPFNARPAGGYAVIAIFLLQTCLCHLRSGDGASLSRLPARHQNSIQEAPWRVALVNTVPYHNEVYCALLWSFQQAGAVTTVFVRLDATWQIQEVIKSWYNSAFRDSKEFLPEACQHDTVVLTTFPTTLLADLLAQQCRHQRIVAVVHNPGELKKPEYQHLLGKVHVFLSLAPHVQALTHTILEQEGIFSAAVQLFVPVFPVTAGRNASTPPSFVLQGLLEKHRRNYDHLFEDILAHEELIASESFQLSIIGRGDLAVPAELASKVRKLSKLPYEEYYGIMESALGILTTFASEVYFTAKASSSVAAALVCSTPLITPRRTLETYTYLTEDAVFISEESDARAMAEALRVAPEALRAKRAAIGTIRERIYADNEILAANIMQVV